MNEHKSYQDFFKEEVYDGFVKHLLDKLGARTVLIILRGNTLFSRIGVNEQLRIEFNKFLSENPIVLKRFADERGKCFHMKNISNGDLAFPVDSEDDEVMIKEGMRVPEYHNELSTMDIKRPTKGMKNVVAKMQGHVFSNIPERPYPIPKRLTVHFKHGYAQKIGKTTLTFMVDSKDDATDILYNRYENKVAYACLQGVEEYVFVKPTNGKIKRGRKL